MRPESMNTNYMALLDELLHRGTTETNARTGVDVRMLEGGWSFKLDLSSGRLPVPGNRRYWPKVAAAETAWQFMGTKDPSWIMSKAPKIWGHFIEDGELKTAYGYRWRKHFGRDQLLSAVSELQANPTNRQLYVSAWDPAVDGLGGEQPKNVPCPVGFSLTTSDGRLHCSMFLRSSDVFVGLPYDVMGYALTTDALARTVGLVPGALHVTLAHPHYYMTHDQYVRDSMPSERKWLENVEPSLPGWSVDEVLYAPDSYVQALARQRTRRHDWSPLPELVV